ncbi:MAG: transposase [Bacteroidota bacterium]
MKIGDLSRKGKNRFKQITQALDKDQQWKSTLIPMGILETITGQGTIVFGNSRETSDFIVDSLEIWYESRRSKMDDYDTIQIELDCGPHNNSRRTQFMKRIAQWSLKIKKKIHLLYFPPYHSKYNPIERFWAALEQYWNGTILNSIEKTIATAQNMKWKGIKPRVFYHDQKYQNGIKLSLKEMAALEKHLFRNQNVGKWNVLIKPNKKMSTLNFL